MGQRFLRAGFPVAWLAICVACAPRAPELRGTPAPAVLPRSELPVGRHRVVFDWTLEDRDFSARGEGAARIAAPDSVRLDFFLAGGIAGGAAVLIGDQLSLPGGAAPLVERLVPPAPLLWGALGRLRLPVMQDTVVRVDGDTLRADIAGSGHWRVTFVRDTLRRIERLEKGRIVESVDRHVADRVRYRNETDRRQLDLHITRIHDVPFPFSATIWTLP